MAITNYSELLTALTNWRGGDTTLVNRYPEWIGLFEAWFNRNHLLRQMESGNSEVLSSNSRSLPTDYITWRSVEWSGVTPRRELEWVHPKRLTSGWPALGSGPEFFTISTNFLGLNTIFVTPPDSANNAVFLRYYAKVPALTASVQTNWLLTAYPDIYLNGCLYEASKTQRDTEAMAIYKGSRDEISAEIKHIPSYGEDAVRTGEFF